MSRLLRLWDYVFVLRPTLLFPVWTVFLAGHSAQLRFGHSLARISWRGAWDFDYILVALLVTLCLGATFVLNQVADMESDRLNRKLFLLATGELSAGSAAVEVGLLGLTSIGLGFVLKPALGVALLGCFLIAGVLYSCRPFVCKDRPYAGLLCNGLGALAVFACGWLVRGKVHSGMWFHALPFVFALWSLYFFTTLPDVEGDRAAGKITIGVLFGPRVSARLALVAEVGTLVSSFLLRDWFIFAPALTALPLFIIAALKGTVAAGVRTTKFGLLFVALAYCYLFPGFLVVLALVFLACKIYYRRRFQINYPSFDVG
ncbi:MAG: UbiA family prenyltransferase [candidate division KSB1 bacterium]|nr:UbiA family prenyltransferase [candidate division KSB1 bacterium]